VGTPGSFWLRPPGDGAITAPSAGVNNFNELSSPFLYADLVIKGGRRLLAPAGYVGYEALFRVWEV